jgi:hypothetical protein
MILLCLAAVWLAGFGLMRWIFPQTLRWSLHNILLFSLAAGAGAGIASCIYFLALLLVGPSFAVLASAIGAFVLIALLAGFLVHRQGPAFEIAEGPPVPRYLILVFAAAAALALIMFLSAVIYNPHGDEAAWSIFNLRARFLFRSGAAWRIAFSHDLAWSHLDYPLLVPSLVAMCWKLAGAESTAAPVGIAFLFGLGTAGVLIASLAILRGKLQALLGGTLFLGTASFVALAASLYADVPLSFYILAALALICLQDQFPEFPRFTILAGLMAGFAAWARNEGLIFVAALLAARSIALARSHRRAAIFPELLRLLAGAAAPLVVVLIFKTRVAPPSEYFSVPASVLLHHLTDFGRWVTLIEGVVIALFTFGRFLIPIVLVLALYAYLIRFRLEVFSRASRLRAALITIAVALPITLGVQLLIDLLYDANLPLEIGTSGERIIMQLWPAAVLAFFVAANAPQLENLKPSARKGKARASAAKTPTAKAAAVKTKHASSV